MHRKLLWASALTIGVLGLVAWGRKTYTPVARTSLSGLPPVAAWWRDQPATLKFGRFLGIVNCYTNTPKLYITWSHRAATSDATQEIALPFWPTAITSYQDNGLLVGGRTGAGNTVLHLYRLGTPALLMVEEPSGESNRIQPASILEILVCYDAAVFGRDTILRIAPGAIQEAKVYFQFWDSGDLYSLEPSDPQSQLQLVAQSAPSVPGVQVVQDLGLGYNTYWSSDHIQHGVIHVFLEPLRISPYPAWFALVLRDADRNGSIDSWSRVSQDEWIQSGYGDGTNYIDHY